MINSINGTRNPGLDVLKALCMLFVTALHVIGYGVGNENLSLFSINYELAVYIRILCNCAVDCFVLITGYVMYNRKIQLKNLLRLWCEVWFYSVTITMLMMIIQRQDIGIKNLLIAAFPICTNRYWFFTLYAVLFLIVPFLNYIVLNSSKKALTYLLLIAFFFSSVVSTATGIDIMYTGSGNGIIWFIILYICGGYLNKYGFSVKRRTVYVVIYLVCSMVIFALQYLQEHRTYQAYGEIYNNLRFSAYTSPLTVIMAISLIGVVVAKESKKKQKIGKFTKKIANLSFGVYLLHDHVLVREYFMQGRFGDYGLEKWTFFILKLFGTIIIIYLIGIWIDLMRHLLFKLIRVDYLCSYIGNKIYIPEFNHQVNSVENIGEEV